MKELQKRSYFEEIERAMRRQGLFKLAEVTIDLKDSGFYVPATTARSTVMFFQLPQRALIIRMEYLESNCRDCMNEESGLSKEKEGVRGLWTITFHTKFLPDTKLCDRLIAGGVGTDEWDKAFAELPFYQYAPKVIAGLTYHENSTYEDLYGKKAAIDPEELTTSIGEVVWKIADWLEYQFDELQVTGFPPHYTFPGCEEMFWDRFGRKNLRGIVRRAWGSTGLKR